MKTHKFARKPFYVDAVRVSEANIDEVAQWCDGTVETNEEGRHVKVKVHRPLTERQTQAFIGDWVLFAGTGFKVYTPKAFDKSFEKVKTLTKAQADAAGIKVPHEPKKPRVGHVGQALQEAQQAAAKKAPVPTPPKSGPPTVIKEARLESVSVVSSDQALPGTSIEVVKEKIEESADNPGVTIEVVPGVEMTSYGEVTEEMKGDAAEVIMDQQLPASVKPAPRFSEIVVDREIEKTYTEEEKDANAAAAIADVLAEG